MPDITSDKDHSELGRRVSFLLSQIGARSAQAFADRLAPVGLRPSQFGVLVALSAVEGVSQQQLADSLGIHRNAMVALVDKLETQGLVERRPHPTDRRAHALHLTTHAREVISRAERLADEQEAQLLAGLEHQDRTILLNLLERVAYRVGLTPGVHPGLQTE
jgi:DNA-binding MarR family transcriptional regulator